MSILAGIFNLIGWLIFIFYGFCLMLVYLGIVFQRVISYISFIHKNTFKDDTDYVSFRKDLMKKIIFGLILIGLGQIFYILR